MSKQFYKLIIATAAIAAVCCFSCASDTKTDNDPTTDPVTTEIVKASLDEGSTVAIDLSKIEIRYSTPIAIAQSNDITLTSAKGDQIEISAKTSNINLSISIQEELAYESQYTLTIEQGAIEAKSSGAKADKYTLSFLSEANPDVDFEITENLINTNATKEAKDLYNYLRAGFGLRTLSGAMCKYTVQSIEADWMKEKTGKYPAILCYDFMNATRTYSWDEPYSTMITSAKEWTENGGIVSAMWHWRDPSRKTEAFYSMSANADTRTSFDISKINDTQSAEYKAIVADIDIVAEHLKELQELNIPVLWRPLHEAQGAWFWWGAGSANDTKALWDLLYDRLTNHHSLNNLIWVWTVDKKDNATNWYPGNNKVDILGTDIYDTPTHDSRRDYFDFVATIGSHKKLVALSECGAIPSPEKMIEGGDTWSWFMPWVADFTQNDEFNGADFLNKILNHDFVITRDEVAINK